MSDLMTMHEAADYLRYTGSKGRAAAYQWCRKQMVPLKRRGNACLVRKADVDRALDGHNFAASRARGFRVAQS